MIVVSDTSPLGNLALIDHLWLLREMYQTVIIPTVVADEIAAARQPSIAAILLDWIQQRSLTSIAVAERLQGDRGLDAGEASAIALAIELQADDLLIDERLGRREALRLGLSTIGILGTLVTAKRRNLIPKVQPIMEALIGQAGFRVSFQLYQDVLRLSQEAEDDV